MVRLATAAGERVELGLSLRFARGEASDRGYLPVAVSADPALAGHIPALAATGQAEVAMRAPGIYGASGDIGRARRREGAATRVAALWLHTAPGH